MDDRPTIPVDRQHIIELDEAIVLIDKLQTSIDGASQIAALEVIFESIAENIYECCKVLENYKDTDTLHEPVRDRLHTLTKCLHHLLLVLAMRCRL